MTFLGVLSYNESYFDRVKDTSFEYYFYYSFCHFLFVVLGHAHLTDFNIATIIKDGERATALAGTKPYMGMTVFTLTTHYTYPVLLYRLVIDRDPIFVSLQQ